MANCILAHPNHADDTTLNNVVFSKGSWLAGHPLDNLQSPFMYKVARSTSASNEHTKFDVDLGGVRDVRVIAFPDHNLSKNATIRIRASGTANDFDTPIYDSGTLDIYEILYTWGSLYWGHPSLWYGKISSEDLAGYRQGWYEVLSTVVNARHWRFEITDTSNTDGFVQLSRLFIAPGWQPTDVNMSYGSNHGMDDPSKKTKSVGGTNYIDRRELYRTAQIVFRDMDEDEGLTGPHDIMRKLGVKDQLYFIWNPDDTLHKHRRAFLATMRSLSAIEYPYFDRVATAFQLEEVI